MYDKMKYVRFIDMDHGVESFIVFSFHMNHDETIKRIRHIEVVSAGFVSFGTGGVQCFGRSESLRIDSQPEDSELLERQMQGL